MNRAMILRHEKFIVPHRDCFNVKTVLKGTHQPVSIPPKLYYRCRLTRQEKHLQTK